MKRWIACLCAAVLVMTVCPSIAHAETADYIVIDGCDTDVGVAFAGSGAIDTVDFKTGTAALAAVGSSGTVAINHAGYSLALPADWRDWYLEAWLYVSDPSLLSNGSCLEFHEQQDVRELQWRLNSLGLSAGWNKLLLPLSIVGTDTENMTTLKGIRLFCTQVTAPLTVKLDGLTLTRTTVATEVSAWNRALQEASAQLQQQEHTVLREVYEATQAAVTQSDVDDATARLTAAIAQAKAGVDTLSVARNPSLVTTYGRVSFNENELRLFWTNSGMSFRFNGTAASATISASGVSAVGCGYLNVYVDGASLPTKTICLADPIGTYVLAEDLPTGEHTVELRKRNEAAQSGSATIGIRSLQVTGGGFLQPPAKKDLQIEIIGDSITSGFGNLVTDGKGEYSSATVEGTMTYAVLAAKQLGAEAHIISRSGMAFCRGTDKGSFMEYYTKTASLPESTIDGSEWDFEANPSDVVVISLGTNDSGALINGVRVDNAFIESEAVEFLKLVRAKNPQAVIVWTYGLMSNNCQKALEGAVAQAVAAGDSKVFYLPLTRYFRPMEGEGVRFHPSIQTEINRSAVLAEFIAEKAGLIVNNRAMLEAQLWWSGRLDSKDYDPAVAAVFNDAMADGEALLNTATATNGDYRTATDAIWKAELGLFPTLERSKDYIVVDACETAQGASFSSGHGAVDTDDAKEGVASLAVSGTRGTLSINHTGGYYGISLPSDIAAWYFECWLYISDPTALPANSTLELSQTVDAVEISWGLTSMGLRSGWNKVILPMRDMPAAMTTLQNIRLFMVDVTSPLTVKLDHVVLTRGRGAGDTAARDAAREKAAAYLAVQENAVLRAAQEQAAAAITQADVDAATLRLQETLATLPPLIIALCGDVDGNNEINSTDARLTLQYAVDKIDETALNTDMADVDGNNEINSTDARLILQYAVGKIEKLPAA